MLGAVPYDGQVAALTVDARPPDHSGREIRRLAQEAARCAAAIVRDGDGNARVGENGVDPRDLSLPVGLVVLDDAERVYPHVADTELAEEEDGVLE